MEDRNTPVQRKYDDETRAWVTQVDVPLPEQEPVLGSGTNARHRMDSALLTVEQAADYLNITDRFVARLIRERRTPFFKAGRLVRLRRVDVDDCLSACAAAAVRQLRGAVNCGQSLLASPEDRLRMTVVRRAPRLPARGIGAARP